MKDITIHIKAAEIKSLIWAIHKGLTITTSNSRYDVLDTIDQRISKALEAK